jgi:hypothetical protein
VARRGERLRERNERVEMAETRLRREQCAHRSLLPSPPRRRGPPHRS